MNDCMNRQCLFLQYQFIVSQEGQEPLGIRPNGGGLKGDFGAGQHQTSQKVRTTAGLKEISFLDETKAGGKAPVVIAIIIY
jgi:hypothetical protein